MKRNLCKAFICTLGCGLAINASLPVYPVFASPLTKQATEISCGQNVRMEEIPASLLEEGTQIDGVESRANGNAIEYQVADSGAFADLLSGSVDGNWSGGCYNGTEDVTICLDTDIVTDQSGISMSQENVTLTLDLNGHRFQSSNDTFEIKSRSADGSLRKVNTVIIQNGTIDGTGLDFSGGLDSAVIQSVGIVNCNGTALNYDNNPSLKIFDCTFSHTGAANGDTGIVCSHSGREFDIQNVVIRGFHTGIDAGYTSGGQKGVLNRITITGAFLGMDLSSCRSDIRVQDSSITGTGEAGSQGIYIFYGTGRYNLSDFLNGAANVDQVVIDNFDTGIYTYSGSVLVTKSKIRNVHTALTGSACGLYVRDSILSASPAVADASYSGDSYGIRGTAEGFTCINTQVSGFRIGAYNSLSSANMMNSIFDNLEINVNVRTGMIYNCLLKNARMGIQQDTSTVDVIDTTILGTGESGSIGVYDNGGAALKLYGTSDAYPAYDTYYSQNLVAYAAAAYPDAEHYSMLIDGYDTGIGMGTRSNNGVSAQNLEIRNCTTGVDGDTHTIKCNEERGTEPTEIRIYNCTDGIRCATIELRNGNLIVYDCTRNGIIIQNAVCLSGGGKIEVYDCVGTGLEVSGLTGNMTYRFETYRCGIGVKLANGLTSPFHICSHNNTGDGIQIAGGRNLTGILSSYDNGGWNINMKAPLNSVMFFTECRLSGGKIGNMNVNMSASAAGNALMFNGTTFICDNSPIFLPADRALTLTPTIGPDWTFPTDWLKGTMCFDVPDGSYVDGTVLVNTSEDFVRDRADRMNNTYLFVRTHFFANKEGWIVQYHDNKATIPSGPGSVQLVLSEGSNVTYDYMTNGGDSLDRDYNIISYPAGDSIDLSLRASRPGYEFLGWNTDPDAHIGLSALTAQKEDITLYAIYRKTVTFTYHTYDTALDYTQDGYIFNQSGVPYADEAGSQALHVLSYADQVPAGRYVFAGYSYDGRDTTGLFKEGIIASIDHMDIYCVYVMNGSLNYLGPDGTSCYQQTVEAFCTVLDTLPYQFSYVLYSYQPQRGYTFSGWRDPDGTLYAPGSIYRTMQESAVLQAEVKPILVSALTVSPKHATMNIGDILQMSVQIQPEDALDQTVTWTSSDPSIAAVDANGLVTAYAEGTVTITATANDGSGCSDTATVEVVIGQEEPGTGSSQAEPSTGSEHKPSGQPKTGDELPLFPLLLLGCLAALAAASGVAARRKDR